MSGARRSGGLAAFLGRACYRVLLVAYPKSFRAELGADAADLFVEACAVSWRERGWRGVLSRFGRALVDVPQNGFAERRGSHAAPEPSRSSGAFWANLGVDVRDTWRALRRRPGLTFAIVATLALAIGANTAVFGVVDATLLRPSPFRDAHRVVYLEARDAANKRAGTISAADVVRWRSELRGLARLEAEATRAVLLIDRNGGARMRAMYGTPGVFEMLGARPILGRLLLDSDAESGGVLVAETLWRSRYASEPGVIGRTVEIDGEPATIVGVIPNLESDIPGIRNLLYREMPSRGEAAEQFAPTVVGWLKPGVTIEALNGELRSATATMDAEGRTSFAQARRPTNIFWTAAEQRNTQLALFTGVCLLLMLAAINVASLLLSATRARAGELALRSALGASRTRIVRLLLLESLMVGAAGCAAGLVIARYAIAAFTQFTPGPQLASRLEAIRLDGVLVGYAVAIAMLTALSIGLAAAWRHARGTNASSLREADARVAGRRGLRGGFVLAESALTVMLLIVAGLVGRAFLTMRFSEPGFAADRVVQVTLALPETTYATPDRRDQFFARLQQDVTRLPGIVQVGLGYEGIPPSDFVMVGRLVADSGVSNEGTGAPYSFVDSRYFPLMGIPILEGRGFDPTEIGKPAGVAEIPALVSRTMAAHFWPRGSAIGRTFTLTAGETVRIYRVRGVTGDVSGWDVIMPGCDRCRWQVYLPLPASRRYTELLARVADGAAIPEAAIKRAILDIDPQVPIDDGFVT
ncbi:MAG TPA: ABC transporter permease, partial [Vicinamibacterales bacterium]|nr:ABC transporter permease [Vicinamibacterales bacterium]